MSMSIHTKHQHVYTPLLAPYFAVLLCSNHIVFICRWMRTCLPIMFADISVLCIEITTTLSLYVHSANHTSRCIII